jgi:REP element-mobilizing transposase RayT
MPRQARIDAPGALHHIIARGIDRSKIFRDAADYDDFLRRLGALLLQTDTQCFAWALLPNHCHLLLKTGNMPITTVMRRLLSGYASGFNRRHRRSGHLFQNRYKSILCQEDRYLKELVRYIHLNPLRASIIRDFAALEQHPYAGHGTIMGVQENRWQTTDALLALFGKKLSQARHEYQEYVASGANLGQQPGLTGGGLIRSTGGWEGVQRLRKAGSFQKSDERILGDGDFVEIVLAEAEENLTRRYAYEARGLTLEHLLHAVATQVAINPEELVGTSKVRNVTKGRALFCYLAAAELGVSMTAIAKYLKIAVSTVSMAFHKGDQVVREEGLKIENLLNVKI